MFSGYLWYFKFVWILIFFSKYPRKTEAKTLALIGCFFCGYLAYVVTGFEQKVESKFKLANLFCF